MGRKPNTEASKANLGIEAKLWPAADKLRNTMGSGAAKTAPGSPEGERRGANQYKAENVLWVPAEARTWN